MKIKLNELKRDVEFLGVACGPSPLKIYEMKNGGCFLFDGEYWMKTSRTANEVIKDFSGTADENEVALHKFYSNINEEVVIE